MKKILLWIVVISVVVVSIITILVIASDKGRSIGANMPTFKEQAITHSHNIEMAMTDGHDGLIENESIERLTKTLEWLKSVEPSTEEEEKIVFMLTEQGKFASSYMSAKSQANTSKANEYLVMYVIAKSITDKLLGLNYSNTAIN